MNPLRRLGLRWPGRGGRFGLLSYRCNICGRTSERRPEELKREEPSCKCGSTVRMRAIIHVLSTELFGQSLSIPDFPHRPDVIGIGMSDWDGYAAALRKKLAYKNTYYHQEPRLDIRAGDPHVEGSLDFLISSDVFEHVAPPISVAFSNARRLLKPNGVLVFSVPYAKEGETKEHFPDLYQYEIIKRGKSYELRNRTRNGVEQTFRELVFHGGDGFTVEMRVFSQSALLREFREAGFSRVKIYNEPVFQYGIFWDVDWSLPMAARVR